MTPAEEHARGAQRPYSLAEADLLFQDWRGQLAAGNFTVAADGTVRSTDVIVAEGWHTRKS